LEFPLMMQFEDLFPEDFPKVRVHVELKVSFDDVLTITTKSSALWLYDWAQLVVSAAQESIVTDRRPSLPGHPPHTKGKPGHNLRDAIKYRVDNSKRDYALDGGLSLFDFPYSVVYVDEALVGEVGGVLEHGGFFRGRNYDPRPFLEPAIEKTFNSVALSFRQAALLESDVSRSVDSALSSLLN
jgi:hypothetical protein